MANRKNIARSFVRSGFEVMEASEVQEWLHVMRARPLPTRGPIRSWAIDEYDDDGARLLTFIRGTGRPADDGLVHFAFGTYRRAG